MASLLRARHTSNKEEANCKDVLILLRVTSSVTHTSNPHNALPAFCVRQLPLACMSHAGTFIHATAPTRSQAQPTSAKATLARPTQRRALRSLSPCTATGAVGWPPRMAAAGAGAGALPVAMLQQGARSSRSKPPLPLQDATALAKHARCSMLAVAAASCWAANPSMARGSAQRVG